MCSTALCQTFKTSATTADKLKGGLHQGVCDRRAQRDMSAFQTFCGNCIGWCNVLLQAKPGSAGDRSPNLEHRLIKVVPRA